MNRQDLARSRNALRNARKTVQETGFASAYLEQVLERQIEKADALLNGEARGPKWSGKHFKPSGEASPEPDVLMTPAGDMILGSTTAREHEAYEQALRVMNIAMLSLARNMRRNYTYHEVKFALKGAAVVLARGASQIVWNATHDTEAPVPRQEDDRNLPAFTFVGDEPPELPMESTNGHHDHGHRASATTNGAQSPEFQRRPVG
jgi:hypothetical protein